MNSGGVSLAGNDDESGAGVDRGVELQEQPSQSMVNVNVVDRITFSNLEALVPPAPRRAADSPELDEMVPPEPIVETEAAGGLSMGYIALIIGIVAVGGFVAFGLMGSPSPSKSPQATAEPAVPSQAKAGQGAPIAVEGAVGELLVAGLTMETNGKKGKQRGILVKGQVKNETDRVQKAIDLEVTILSEKLAVHQSRQRCCRLTDGDQGPATLLRPGQSQAFGFEVPGLKHRPKDLSIEARVIFAESEKLSP